MLYAEKRKTCDHTIAGHTNSCLADYIHMTHQQPCGAKPGGSNWLLLKSALVEYHVFTASKRKRRYSRNIFFATA
jgi:hypothetical protein